MECMDNQVNICKSQQMTEIEKVIALLRMRIAEAFLADSLDANHLSVKLPNLDFSKKGQQVHIELGSRNFPSLDF